jgi:hypothetical protein
MSFSHLERAEDAAAYAATLRTDLATLSSELENFRGASGLELLRDRSLASQQQLDLIAARLGALGRQGDPGLYPLSEVEHAILDSARALRERMTESLSRYQRAQHRPIGRIG